MRRAILIAALCSASLVAALPLATAAAEPALSLQTRVRVESAADGGRFAIRYETVRWNPDETAVIVCDMWQRHWCDGAVKRGAEMAPRMNRFITEARERGALIVHAPSSGMEHYADHPARHRAQNAPQAENLPEGIAGWCKQIDAEKKGVWPVDQSDGGCDCRPRCPNRKMDVRQADSLAIDPADAITDSGVECWNVLEQHGVENVILVGVHTNMCVIGRPFGLRNMVRFGKNVVLVRDLTDTMYNSRKAPFVSHVRGTELVVEHIEKFVCPTITSGSLLGGPALRFEEDKRPHVAMIVSDDHYHADKTLPLFARELRDRYGCYCTLIHGEGTDRFAAMEELKTADVAVLYIRRMALPKGQLDLFREFLDSGKPLIALRTASHAFAVHGETPAGHAQWRAFDGEVLGGSYNGHGPNPAGSDVDVVVKNAGHAVLSGVAPAAWHSTGSLYYTAPVAEDATILMNGSVDGRTEPITWVRKYKNARVFYTGLGHPDDFREPQFRKLLVNALFWAMDKPVPESGPER